MMEILKFLAELDSWFIYIDLSFSLFCLVFDIVCKVLNFYKKRHPEKYVWDAKEKEYIKIKLEELK